MKQNRKREQIATGGSGSDGSDERKKCKEFDDVENCTRKKKMQKDIFRIWSMCSGSGSEFGCGIEIVDVLE